MGKGGGGADLKGKNLLWEQILSFKSSLLFLKGV